LFLVAFLFSLSACGSKNSIEGKWEVSIASKRTGQISKVNYEFLPDGTFNATPPGDTTVVDKDKYQVLDEGRTVKFRSQFFKGEAVCTFGADRSFQCEADDSYVTFKRL
jgi:hypothetical protein